MIRYRWVEAKWPFSMRTLAKKMKEHSFVQESASGFIVDRARDSIIEARYVERHNLVDRVTSPFGVEVEYERVEYRECEFVASQEGPGLELVEAPRSTQSMLSHLVEICDFELSVSPLIVDVKLWAAYVRDGCDLPTWVDSIQIGSLDLAKGVSAKALIKGSTDVGASLKRLAEGKSYKVEKIRIRTREDQPSTIVLSSSGSASINVYDNPHIAHVVRSSIARLANEASR